MKSDFLVSGVKGGIGRYIFEELGGKGFGRDISKEELDKIMEQGAETIIHCAFGKPFEDHEEDFILTKKLTKSPHKKFVYFSSVDVYENNGSLHKEDEKIDNSKNEYGRAKLNAERIVLKNSENPLILRCSGLLGPYSRKNNLLKLINDDNPQLSLTLNSELNVVLYEDVLKFILDSKENTGIYNISSSKNITIEEISNKLKKNPKYGKFNYSVGNIDNSKAKYLNSKFAKTSLEIIEGFIK